MKNKFLKGIVASFALAVSGIANAGLIEFDYTGSLDSWTVTESGTYRVTAIGGQGGHGTIDNRSYVGGRGAQISGTFDLLAGDSFWIAVGGMGSSFPNQYNGGGGGGSFFVGFDDNPLLISGGGGGIRSYAGQNGFDASITEYGALSSGSNSSGIFTLKTDDLGLGGDSLSFSWGAGGAGFYGNGANDSSFGLGGSSWANGLLGGTGNYDSGCNSRGGFGGGGSGSGCGGGGGGGGYSGGDGGFIGGGGGSFNSGYDQYALAGVGYGNGSLTIERLDIVDVPEPSTVAVFALGLLGLASRKFKKQA